MDEVFSIESSSSYMNAFGAAWLPYYDPYAKLVMAEPLDMERVRNGEPKYLVRGLYAIKYPELEIPFKIPMPRPVDSIFKDWEGPRRGGAISRRYTYVRTHWKSEMAAVVC